MCRSHGVSNLVSKESGNRFSPSADDELRHKPQCFSDFSLRCGIGPTANSGTQVDGAGEGTRTPDLVITNDPLYLLSYTGATSVIADADAPKKPDLRCSENSFCRFASWNSCGMTAPAVIQCPLSSDIARLQTGYLISDEEPPTF